MQINGLSFHFNAFPVFKANHSGSHSWISVYEGTDQFGSIFAMFVDGRSAEDISRIAAALNEAFAPVATPFAIAAE